jgi:hypothetical protein
MNDEQLPALPNHFRKTALAFPEHAKTIIAALKVPGEAAEGVAKSQALAKRHQCEYMNDEIDQAASFCVM